MSAQPVTTDHTSRTKYPDTLAALVDARRVCDDLLAILPGDELLVSVDRIEFLARRTRKLVAACVELETAAYHKAAHS